MSKKILITDDTMFMRVTLKNLLTSNGYEVVAEAENGQEAVEKYSRLRPDLVMMDITMPVMDGIAATRAIHEQNPDAKVVMCTAMGQKNMVVEALQAGAKDFIAKPFQADRVLDAVKKLIG